MDMIWNRKSVIVSPLLLGAKDYTVMISIARCEQQDKS